MKIKILILTLFLSSSFLCASMPEFFNNLAKKEERSSIDVVPYLELEKGDVVADLGAGGGYFSVKMARAVGKSGLVYAVDISKESIAYIKEYAKEQGAANVKTILTDTDDARLSKDAIDLVFIRNTYHHLEKRVEYFKRLAKSLKHDGRIAIIDYLPEKSGFTGHASEVSMIIEEMERAGFALQKRIDKLPRQSFLIFSR